VSKQTVLVIEDDAAIRRGVADALHFEGYETLEAADGHAGMKMGLEVACDLVLLDLVLPGREGLAILAEVRRSRPTLPVIIMTARGAENDRVRGLKLGADDYVVKPFSVKELLARVEAVLRRTPGRPLDVRTIALPDGEVDLENREARFVDGRRSELSERETELLRYLAVNAGRVISRDEIMQHVWRLNPHAVLETRTIDMHVARLREKLGDTGERPCVILTVRGKGYLLGGKEIAP